MAKNKLYDQYVRYAEENVDFGTVKGIKEVQFIQGTNTILLSVDTFQKIITAFNHFKKK